MNMCKVHNVKFYKLEPKAIHCMTYDSTNRKLAVSRADNSLEIWCVRNTAHLMCCLPGLSDSSIESLQWCGNRLFSTGLQGVVVEYDCYSLSVKYSVHVTGGAAWCLHINAAQTHLAVGTEDGYVNIFSITEDSLKYEKILDKQEGRILCLSWDVTGDMIITGSIDTVRIWNVQTGHAIHKMTTGRVEAKKETIVWCLTVTDELTIISGDSRGRLCFWDGHSGVLMETYESHVADIFCLCLSSDNNSLYCAGVDPVIVNFVKIQIRGPGSNKRWVKSVQRRIHEHDVRSLVVTEDGRLFSGGLDGYLAISSYPPKYLQKYPPLLQGPSVVLAKQARCILLRNRTSFDVWRLGQEEDSGVNEPPIKLLSLESSGSKFILSAAISNDAMWLAYSTAISLHLYSFFPSAEEPKLKKIRDIPKEIGPCHKLAFSSNSKILVAATCQGEIVAISVGEESNVLYTINLHTSKVLTDAVFLLLVTSDDKYLIAADHNSNIVAWILNNGKYYCSLPRYANAAPTACAVNHNGNLVIVYSDHKIVEYNLSNRQFTKFSRGMDSKHPKQWLSRGCAVINVTFDPRNPDIILLQDDNGIYAIDKNKKLPMVDAKIPRLESSQSDSRENSISHPPTVTPLHAFHVIKKYKHLVHLEWLKNEEVVAVELSPSALIAQLPPVLAKKRFGM